MSDDGCWQFAHAETYRHSLLLYAEVSFELFVLFIGYVYVLCIDVSFFSFLRLINLFFWGSRRSFGEMMVKAIRFDLLEKCLEFWSTIHNLNGIVNIHRSAESATFRP